MPYERLKLVSSTEQNALSHAPTIVPSLLSIAKLTRAMVGLRLAEIGLFNGQDQLLMLLKPGKTITVSEAAEVTNIRPSTVSKMTDRLVLKGLMQRTSNERDGRITTLTITAKGIEVQSEILELWRKLGDEIALSLGSNAVGIEDQLDAIGDVLATRLRRLR